MATHADEKGSSSELDAHRDADRGSDEIASGQPSPTLDDNQLKAVPSQSEKMGKKQIAVVMVALCVCSSLHFQPGWMCGH